LKFVGDKVLVVWKWQWMNELKRLLMSTAVDSAHSVDRKK